MAKEYGHTKTLFIQWWKYKWSYKYEHCISCGKVDKPHKWRWLCTRCRDKKRDQDPKRKEQKYKACIKWHENNYKRIPREEWKPMGNLKRLTPEQKKEYQHQWYMKNREVIWLLRKWEVRKRKWLPTIQILWKHIPYFDITKPLALERYDEWKKNMELFDKVRKYLNKT